MERKEKILHAIEISLGVLGAGLLIAILVLKITKHEMLYLTYPLVGVVIAFLIVDECARVQKRKRLQAEAEAERTENESERPESELPKEAFEFDETKEEP